MSNLSEYIKQVEKYLEEHPDTSERLLTRYVYWDLGLRFSFNPEFRPFGSSKRRQQIYKISDTDGEIEKGFRSNFVICKTESKALEKVLKHFGTNIETVEDSTDYRRCPHVYNIIRPKDGSEPYSVDLQEDMYRMQMHGFTTNYGLSTRDGRTLIIPRFEQEQMDRQLGYIDNEHYYTDEYLYLIKSDIGFFEDFGEKAKFLLENIDTFENPQMQYTDRMWYHVRILQQFFSLREFDYDHDKGQIHMVNCYKDVNGERKYINCIAVRTVRGTDVYIYNKEEGSYSQIDIVAFARAVKNGLVIHDSQVPGLGKALKQVKAEGR